MKNGRTKGNVFELSVARVLHAVIVSAVDQAKVKNNLPARELCVRRRTTTVAPMDDWKGEGDLQISSRYYARLLNKYDTVPCVECKNIGGMNTANVLLSPSDLVKKAWYQAVRQAQKMKQMHDEYFEPILALGISNVGILMLVSDDSLRDLLQSSNLHQAFLKVSFGLKIKWEVYPYCYALLFPPSAA